MTQRYELPEPVEIEAGRLYVIGVKEGAAFAREASDEDKERLRPASRPHGALVWPLRPNETLTEGLVAPEHDMTARWVWLGVPGAPAATEE